MSESADGWSRELAYYRRECNDLGARLLRLQEEQSQAFREARRSRTVVKLLREAYRLGDMTIATQDVGGPMLELLADNTLCDRAMLLREEPIGGGTFLVAQAIGLIDGALDAPSRIPSPPAFLFTTGQSRPDACASAIVAAIGVPYVLWAYDRGSGHALVIGNRSESNVSRPFEPGDQELIEAALSVYIDVLYRKQTEAQLRQAKQTAEASGRALADGMAALAAEVREPLHAIADLAASQQGSLAIAVSEPVAENAEEIAKLARYVLMAVDGAAERPGSAAPALALDVQWVPIEEVMRAALASSYSTGVKLGIDLDCTLPRRRTAVLADRRRMQHVIQHLVASVMRGTSTGGSVRVSTTRRSDGALEMLIGSRGGAPLSVASPLPTRLSSVVEQDAPSLSFARAIVDAHEWTLNLETSAFGGMYARLVLPAQKTRDVDLAEITL